MDHDRVSAAPPESKHVQIDAPKKKRKKKKRTTTVGDGQLQRSSTKAKLNALKGSIGRGMQKTVVNFLGIDENEDSAADASKQDQGDENTRKFANKWMYKTQAAKLRREKLIAKKWQNKSIYFKQKFVVPEEDPEELYLQSTERDLEKRRATSDAEALAEFNVESGSRPPKGAPKDKKKKKKKKKDPADDDYKPVFTYVVTIVNCLMMALTIWMNGGFAAFPDVNPFGGPSVEILIKYGAKYGPPMLDPCGQMWRVVTAIFLHVGIIHLLMNTMFLLQIGKILEERYGAFRIAPIYLISGVAGNYLSCVFVPNEVTVGASGGLYGFFGVLLVDLLQNWKNVPKPYAALTRLVITILFSLGIGLLPYVDNFAHLGGFVFGILTSAVFLPNITFGVWTARFKKILVLVLVPLEGFLLFLMYYLFNGQYYAYNWCSFCSLINCIPVANWCSPPTAVSGSGEWCSAG